MAQEVYFSDIKNTIIKNLKNCNYDLRIAVAWFTDEKIISVVNDLLLEGVSVTIIIYDDYINRKNLFEKLYHNKASILLSKKLMHNKFCVIDYKTVINGSYNWTNNAKTNDENIQITFNDETFANNFIEEFDKISSNCNKIDEYFKHSLLNIKNIEFEFESFYLKWPNYIFPYFFDLKTFSPSKINSKLEINGYVYLIKNKKEERNFLWIYFLSQSNYSVIKILSTRNEKVLFPLRFNNVCLNSINKDNVAEFLNSNYIVEEHVRKNSRTFFFLFRINKEGQQISEKIEFTNRISNQFYLYSKNDKSYFIDKNLIQIYVDYIVEEFFMSSLFVVSELKEGKKTFGLIDVNTKILIPIIYDKYIINRKDLYIDFVEFPVLERVRINNSVEYIKGAVYNINQYNGRFVPFVDRLFYRYSIDDYKLKEKFILSKFDIKQTDDSYTYYFLSEENYKYKEFYLKVKNFKFDTSKVKADEVNLTYNEFQELKKDYYHDTSFNFLTKKYQVLREKALIEEKRVKTKMNEGGCYIATMVYEDYNHPDVLLLRNFRDNFLNKNLLGILFVKIYYNCAPYVVNLAKRSKPLHFILKIFIYNLVCTLKKRI